jgi:hypothetical protein
MTSTPDLAEQGPGMSALLEGIATGTREFAGFIVSRLDLVMERGISLRDQEILYEFRALVVAEIARRFPEFDLEAEARTHR